MLSSELIIKYAEYTSTFNILLFTGFGWVFSKEVVAKKISFSIVLLIVSFVLNSLSVYNLIELVRFTYLETAKNQNVSNFVSDSIKSSIEWSGYFLWGSLVALIIYVIWWSLENKKNVTS